MRSLAVSIFAVVLGVAAAGLGLHFLEHPLLYTAVILPIIAIFSFVIHKIRW